MSGELNGTMNKVIDEGRKVGKNGGSEEEGEGGKKKWIHQIKLDRWLEWQMN